MAFNQENTVLTNNKSLIFKIILTTVNSVAFRFDKASHPFVEFMVH